jgi:3'-phosphoadenosine 5'-phosphosulfate sulfotransferase (PAPS reductase)/FAD synthetase
VHNVALAFSSGKDSVVLDYLAKEAGVKVQRFHNVTTIDPPGTIMFAQKHGCEIVRNKLSFLDLVEKKGFPTMFRRFCCKELKERYYAPYVLFGIRREESNKRSSCYSSYEDMYYYTKKVFTNRFFPLLQFTDSDIAEIINANSLECHPLYYDYQGKFCVERRLGCIGCPLQGDRGKIDYLEYPKLLKQVLRRGILFHQRQGRTENDAALNLVYNLFYSNHGYEKFQQTYKGLFDTDPWEMLAEYFFIDKDDVMSKLPKPKF